MRSIGLVLSAGGAVGDPWHAGVLLGIREATGWDARTADVIVGTSAGAISAVGLRAGLSPADRFAAHRGDPISDDGQAILDRMVTPWSSTTGDRDWRPQAPAMSARSFWPPWKPHPLRAAIGLLPAGTQSNAALGERMEQMHPGGWPGQPTWIVTVRLTDGARVVFGRDDVRGDVGETVRASTAVPAVYEPITIGRHRYVDGGAHSSTNADLVAPLGFDLVIISSAMTATGDAAACTSANPLRTWFSRRLAEEVELIRSSGTAVLVAQADGDALSARDAVDADDHDALRRLVSEQGRVGALARLDRPDGIGIVNRLRGHVTA